MLEEEGGNGADETSLLTQALLHASRRAGK